MPGPLFEKVSFLVADLRGQQSDIVHLLLALAGEDQAQGFRVPPFAAEDIIRQARRYKSKRELTGAIRLIAKADLALRSNPASKRLVLEKLVLDLTAEPKPDGPWQQDELPV